MERTLSKPSILVRLAITLLSVIQLLPLSIGWISYLLGSITASLFTWISYLSLLWYPVDWLCKYLWMGCDVLKQKLMGQSTDWLISSRRWNRHFPIF